jgi:hypothetical protein
MTPRLALALTDGWAWPDWSYAHDDGPFSRPSHHPTRETTRSGPDDPELIARFELAWA